MSSAHRVKNGPARLRREPSAQLTMCLHDRYFDGFGGPAGWIESVTAAAVSVDGRGEGISGRRAGAGRDRCILAGCSGIRARRESGLSRAAMEGAECQSLESGYNSLARRARPRGRRDRETVSLTPWSEIEPLEHMAWLGPLLGHKGDLRRLRGPRRGGSWTSRHFVRRRGWGEALTHDASEYFTPPRPKKEGRQPLLL